MSGLDDISVPAQPLLDLIARMGGVKAACIRMAGRYRNYGTWERAIWRIYNDPRFGGRRTTVSLTFADEVCTALGTHIDLIYGEDDFADAAPVLTLELD